MLALGVFLPLVLTALTVSWHNRDIRGIGFALLLSWAASNATAIWLPFSYRPIIYPVLEVIIGLMAAGAWLALRFLPEGPRAGEGQTLAIGILIAALINVAACVNYSLQSAPGYGDKYLFALVTNLSFAAECLLLTYWGVRDAIDRAAGVARLFYRSRHSAPSHRSNAPKGNQE